MSSKNASRQQVREARKAAQKRKQVVRRAMIVGAVVVVVGGLAALALLTKPTETGEVVEIMADALEHVADGTEIEYSTNPPTSGPHYGEAADGGFYDDPVPDGHLIHNLEHGYVIVWYDCEQMTESECESTKEDIKDFVTGRAKLIGMPRTGMDSPVAFTSWGRILLTDSFSTKTANDYVRANLNKSPEPNAP